MFSGDATISDGRIRYLTLPHSLQAINGKLSFDAQGIRIDDMTARAGRRAGPVRRPRSGIKGYTIGDLNLTATGEQMHLRYPEGFRSTSTPTLDAARQSSAAGARRHRRRSRRRLYRSDSSPTSTCSIWQAPAAQRCRPRRRKRRPFPVRFDIQVQAPATLRVENNLAHWSRAADLTLTGTYDRPVLLRPRRDRRAARSSSKATATCVTRGTIDFLNPGAIEPFFDIEAETRVRVAEPRSIA